MNEQYFSRYQDFIVTTATEVGLKVLAAIAFWVIGRWLIGLAVGMVRKALESQKIDPTVLRYIGSILTVTLNLLLVIGILGDIIRNFTQNPYRRVDLKSEAGFPAPMPAQNVIVTQAP